MKVSKKSILLTLIYFVVFTLFFKNFIYQYISLFILFVFLCLSYPLKFKKDAFSLIIVLFIFVAFVSWIYNLISSGLADFYSFYFWLFSYLPPLLLLLIILKINNALNFNKIYKFYKSLVFIQALLMIFAVFQYRKFIVGDYATGTLGDANFVAYHFCIIIIIETVTLAVNRKMISQDRVIIKLFEIAFWSLILLIPESTANFGFIVIVLGSFVFIEFFIKKITIIRSILITMSIVAAGSIVTNTFIYQRFLNLKETIENSKNLESNAYFTKLIIYKKVFSGTIFRKANFLIGTGPSTFTSRSSVMRIPEIRYNQPPFEVPYFKNSIFKKHVQKSIEVSYKSSFGNFGSPQTTIVSITVELGALGLFIFGSLFFMIIFRNVKINKRKNYLRYKLVKCLTFFYALNLFFLNSWEYPIFTFTYILFVFLLLNSENSQQEKTILYSIN
jgi:hypothetical protein